VVGSPPALRAENLPDVTRNDTNRAPRCDAREAVIAGLAGDQARNRCTAPVTVGEAIGRFEIVAAGLHTG